MDNSQSNLKIFFSNKTKLKELVIKALQSSSSSAYQTLIEHIQHLTRNYLKDWLNVLQECVSLFNVKKHDEILSVLQEFNWFTEDDETVKAYQSFWVHLVGAHSSLVFGVYCMIARAFAIREGNQVILRRNSEQVAVLLHELISMLISTVPTSTSSLFDSLRDQFPYYSNPLQNYQQYNRNLLIITTYCPVLRDKIIELIIDKLMQLELTLPNDSDLIYTNNDTDVNYDDDFDQFEMELPINNYNNNNNNNKSTASTPTMKLNDIKILKESIDETMVILFEYIKQQSDSLMELLLKLFETKLLVTKYSKMTQFIIFYLCAVNKNNGYLLFLKLLIDKWSNNNEHISTRLFSLDYLCSFICRAKYIPVDTIQNIIKTLQYHLIQYIDSYNKQLLWKRNSNGIINNNNNNNNNNTTLFNPQQHILFYNTFQGLIYILCFLYDVFVQQGIHVHEYFISLNLDNILSCDLKPLNYCMRDIVDLFIEKSYSFGTISVKDYVLRNNNNSNSVKSPLNNATNSNNENPLDTYFPFDPYLLTHSRKLVNPYYRYWEEDGDLNNATPNFTRRRSISRISNGDPNSYSRLSMSFDGNNSFDLSSSLNYLSQSNGSINNNNNNSSYLSPNPYGNNNTYGASLESY